jgi:hypothetical protein
MKKTQTRLLILISIVPAIILLFFLIISGVSIKDFPLWAIIVIPTLILVTPFMFLLAQCFAQRAIYDAPLQKKKKRILIVWGVYAIFTTIVLIILYHVRYQSFWITFLQLFPVSFFILFGNFRLFFPKKEKSTENDNQNNLKQQEKDDREL